ncbi:hypothetical protein DFS34DRAFT_192513 [Phlyctochytrium arcticum]|nr:hypothetical protein DFS34DRAFT_192513 [Phlyctochytrium arcticum]
MRWGTYSNLSDWKEMSEGKFTANKRVTDQINQQFATVDGSNNTVRCKTCRISIKNKMSVKKKHMESTQANPADNTIPHHLATDDSTISDPTPMEVDLEALGVYNPSTQTSPTNGFNLFHYLREQAERARLEAEAEELDGRKKDQETFEWEQPATTSDHSCTAPQHGEDDPKWFPFPNRRTALCAILMTMPTHPLSNAVLKMIWWWAGQL